MTFIHQKEVKLGLLGGGFVADFYMQGLKNVPGQEVVMVYSRREDHPEIFAKKYKARHIFTDYEYYEAHYVPHVISPKSPCQFHR